MYQSSADGVAGYTPPQWSIRKDKGFLKGNGSGSASTNVNNTGFLQTGNNNPNNSVAGQHQRAIASMTPQYGAMSSAQGYAGGVRQGSNYTIGDANFGGVAAIQNYLNGLQQGGGSAAYQQGAQYLRQNGLMPTYNGSALDRLPGAGDSALGYGATGNQAYSAQAQQDWQNGANARAAMGGNPAEQAARLAPGVHLMDGKLVYNPTGGVHRSDWVPWTGSPAASGGAAGSPSGAPNILGGGGVPSAGGTGPTGLPLEGAVQDSIGGILAGNGNPLNPQQAQYQRNQTTNSIDQQYGADSEALQADAVRRGVNATELGGSQRALAQGARNSRQQALTQFDIANAQNSMQNKLAAANAGTNLMNTQVGNEDSLRRYYAMLGAAQSGAPMFIGGLK